MTKGQYREEMKITEEDVKEAAKGIGIKATGLDLMTARQVIQVCQNEKVRQKLSEKFE